MGLLSMVRGKAKEAPRRSALDEAAVSDDKVTAFLARVIGVGIDGGGRIASAQQAASRARARGSVDDAIAQVISRHSRLAGAGGFVTGLGGFVTMLVALPANVVGFHVLAARMVAAIAELRGYDTKDPHIRTAVLLTLVGADADKVLKQAGISTGSSAALGVVASRLPRSALMVVNKAVGFRIIKGLSGKLLGRLGRAVPVVGGAIGAVFDTLMLRRIAEAAKREFPQV